MEALPRVRHTVTYRRITVLPFRVRIATLPSIAGAKICSLADLVAASSLAISNLTRKVARAASGVSASTPAAITPESTEPGLFGARESVLPTP